ncbi:PepSY domain-containing protein [Hyphomicrobium sp.]|uniref:PepSY domain-containing protein n=1 Tax=Hyphomicrobium sp. TaxID=82 RepID=UPI002D7A1C5A|nr:PepSY domain-containing protein [Hyphomicrobium sp.]HET6388553.1 PepSY domain-containing protein [Hyphomicrobium sp.]
MKRTISLILAAFLATGGIALAGDDVPGADWMPKEEVIKKVEAAGYSNVTGVHADDGYWEGKGVKNGKIMEFHVDPRSGAITKEEIED